MRTSILRISTISVAAILLSITLAVVFSVNSTASPSPDLRSNVIERSKSPEVKKAEACTLAEKIDACKKECAGMFNRKDLSAREMRACLSFCNRDADKWRPCSEIPHK